MSDVEMRCKDCIDLAIECPLHYFTGVMKCDVCSFKFVLTSPNCAPREKVTCPVCDGTVDEV